MIFVRAFESFDVSLLAHFLALASHEEKVEAVFANPSLAIYVDGWGRSGDCAVVAEDAESHAVVGAAWARFWTLEHHGFGWMDELTPELAIAVEPAFQEQGVGTRLIKALKCHLHTVEIPRSKKRIAPTQVSLNVRAGSPAIHLYERLGFVKVEGSERTNRTGGVSFNMIAPL